MKKILLVVVMIFAALPMNAQFSVAGVRLASGFAYASDDLFDNAPILSCGAGLFVQYGFTKRYQHFAVQGGLFVERCGSRYTMDFPVWESVQKGKYAMQYLSLPVLVNWNKPLYFAGRGKSVNINVGPEFRCGLFGRINEEQTSDITDNPAINYEIKESAFKHLRRLDVGLQSTIGFELNNLTLDFVCYWGFIPLRDTKDVYKYIDTQYGTGDKLMRNETGHTGTNRTFSIALGYKIPFRQALNSAKTANPFKK